MKEKSVTILEYDRKAVSLSNRYESADVIRLQNTLLTVFKDCKSILELGCGSGRDAAFLQTHMPEAILKITDGSSQMLKKAAELHPELGECLAVYELPGSLQNENERFDGIYSIGALMHLPESEIIQSLRLITGLLEDDGILFISVCTDREEPKSSDPRCFTLKSKKWWISEIEECGLSLVSATVSRDGLKRENTVWLDLTAVNQKK